MQLKITVEKNQKRNSKSTRNNNIFIHKDILLFSKFLLSFVLIHLSSNPFEIINHRVFISFRSRDYLGKPFLSLIFLVKRKWVVTYFPPPSLVLHNFHKQRKNAKKRKPSSSLHRKKNVGPRFKNRFEFQGNVHPLPPLYIIATQTWLAQRESYARTGGARNINTESKGVDSSL